MFLGTGVFTDVFTDVFTGVFTDVFTDVFPDVVTGAFTGAFTDVFTGVFTDVFTGVFTDVFTDVFTYVFQRIRKLRIQEGHFMKIDLNLVLTLPDDEVLAFLISCGIIDLGTFCVELWSFFVSKRISVPMSYTSLWEYT